MPDRIVRSAILTSDAVNSLSWAAEVFYRRLFSIIDDHGRYDARPSILRAQLYPLKLGSVAEPDIGKWMSECSEAGLVRVYEIQGRPYLEVFKFEQRLRSKSKWPDPPTSADNCAHPLTNAAVFVDVDVDVCVVGPRGAPFDSESFREAWSKWKAYTRSIGKPTNEIMEAEQFRKLKPLGEARAIAMIEASIRNGWKNLNEETLKEEPAARKTLQSNEFKL